MFSADNDSKVSTLIARQEGRTFAYNDGSPTITYTDGAGTELLLFLACKPDARFLGTKNEDRKFTFYIENPCACPGKCTYQPDRRPNRLSIGAVFVIVLLSLIGTYLLVGVLFLRFVRHERGTALLPNRSFWLQVGQDTIGGVRFTLFKLTGRKAYQQI